ncbi:uncharacterized protein LOC142240650 isoform X2 [Haematobia irritans]|uniref:uncharacterized protein LOC142240650 isoform X2 n=1 Tax=Haematobia irritans TaxID=7368 RepID=UPI003F4F42B5
MLSCRKLLPLLIVFFVVVEYHKSLALPVAEAEAEPAKNDANKLLVITEDVIPDIVEMDQKKVIRVNPLDLPPIKEDPNKKSEDSSLYKIQSIKPYQGKRKYANSQHIRKPGQQQQQQQGGLAETNKADTPIIRGIPADQKTIC